MLMHGSQGETAMHLAASEGLSEVCVMLYEHDPQLLHLRDNWNTTPIMRSIDQVPLFLPSPTGCDGNAVHCTTICITYGRCVCLMDREGAHVE